MNKLNNPHYDNYKLSTSDNVDLEFEKFIEENENALMELWDIYKYEEHGDLFHYDNVDFFDNDYFEEMVEKVITGEIEL